MLHVPQWMIDELAADKEKAKAGITGVELAAKVIKECRPSNRYIKEDG